MAALFFTVLAGLFLAACLAMLWFALGPGGKGGLPAGALLVPTIVLLALVLLLLLVLLWCCCCRGRGGDLARLRDLLKLLPQLPQLTAGLGDAAKALDAMAAALRLARTPVEGAGGALYDAGERVDVSLPTVEPVKKRINWPGGGAHVVVGLQAGASHSPFGDAKDRLHAASSYLKGDDSLSAKMEEVARECNNAATGLRAAKEVLDIIIPAP